MRSKAALAILVAVVLLSISCVASACEISCGLRMCDPGCCDAAGSTYQSSHRYVAHPRAEMQDCGMKSAGASAARSLAVAGVHATPCAHATCGQEPAAMARNAGEVASRFPALQRAMLLTVLKFTEPDRSSRRQVYETPPTRALFLISLQSTIRV
jgi:hypothetical protein